MLLLAASGCASAEQMPYKIESGNPSLVEEVHKNSKNSENFLDELIKHDYFLKYDLHLDPLNYASEHYRIVERTSFDFSGTEYCVLVVNPLQEWSSELFVYKNNILENRTTTIKRARTIHKDYPGEAKRFLKNPESASRAEYVAYLYFKADQGLIGKLSEQEFIDHYLDTKSFNGIAGTYVHEIVHIKCDSSPPHPTNIFALGREEGLAVLAPSILNVESPYIALANIVYWDSIQDHQDPHKFAADQLIPKLEFLSGKNLLQMHELSEEQLFDLYNQIAGKEIRGLFQPSATIMTLADSSS